MSQHSNLVNVDASHYSGDKFTSTVNPNSVNSNSMPLPGNNIQSAASYFPCTNQKGGKIRKINRNKINIISGKYKMKGNRKHITRRVKRMKSRLRSKYSTNKRSRYATRRRGRGRSMGQRGGNAQYQNNVPMTTSYSTGGHLAPSSSALANPVPYKVLSNCTNCVDNYNHFTNSGFSSKGSY